MSTEFRVLRTTVTFTIDTAKSRQAHPLTGKSGHVTEITEGTGSNPTTESGRRTTQSGFQVTNLVLRTLVIISTQSLTYISLSALKPEKHKRVVRLELSLTFSVRQA